MNQASYIHTDLPELTSLQRVDKGKRQMYILAVGLVLLTLGIELLVPFLSWKRIVPNATIYLSELTLGAIGAIALMRMLVFDRIPVVVILILGLTGVGSVVAIFEEQSGIATIWGWWQLFKYPLIGLFFYLQPWWPPKFATWLYKGCVGILVFEVLVQLGQYVTGEIPGDDLAGSFGWHGVGPLALFTFLVLSLAFGHWLATDDWRQLIGVVGLCALSNVLAENKIFLVAVLVLAILAMGFYFYCGQRLQNLLLYFIIFSVMTGLFIILYNTTVADVRGTRRINEYFELERVQAYLNNTDYNEETGEYYLGRGFAARYGWELLQRDWTTFWFGYGIGARTESTALGIVGSGLQQGYYGLFVGTSLLVLMQEVGIVGLAVLALFLLWTVIQLLRLGQQTLDIDTKVLCYGMILYTCAWPLWLWYHKTWGFGVSMILYWGTLGYLMQKALVGKRDECANTLEMVVQ